jgi:hypothetical protein
VKKLGAILGIVFVVLWIGGCDGSNGSNDNENYEPSTKSHIVKIFNSSESKGSIIGAYIQPHGVIDSHNPPKPEDGGTWVWGSNRISYDIVKPGSYSSFTVTDCDKYYDMAILYEPFTYGDGSLWDSNQPVMYVWNIFLACGEISEYTFKPDTQ